MATFVKAAPEDPRLLLGVGVGLSLLVGIVSYLGSPLLVTVLAITSIGGVLLLLRPELGVFLLFTTFLFKYPEFLEGSGWLTINNLLGITLSLILIATVVVQKRFEFLKVHQVQLFLIIGLVILGNYLFIGRIEAPSYLSSFDLTERVRLQFTNQLAFLIFFVVFIRSPRHLLVVISIVLVGIFYTVPGAISNTLTSSAADLSAEHIRAAGTSGIKAAGNSNRLAFLCLMGVTFIMFALQEYRIKLLRFIGGAASFVLVLTIILSGSRSGVLNLFLLPLLLLFQGAMRRAQLAVAIFLLIVTFCMSLALAPESVLNRLGTLLPSDESATVVKSGAESTEDRLKILRIGFHMFMESPLFGVGIGNFRWKAGLDPLSGGLVMPSHNSYLLALAEGGLILLGAYCLLFWRTFQDLGRALELSLIAPHAHIRWILLATRTNLILLLVFSFFADIWTEFYYFLVFSSTGVLTQIYQQQVAELPWAQPQSST